MKLSTPLNFILKNLNTENKTISASGVVIHLHNHFRT